MTTRLHKAIVRETVNTAVQGRPLIVAMEPGDTIAFRRKGCRRLFRTTIAACFWMAAKAEAREQARLKELARREGGRGRH